MMMMRTETLPPSYKEGYDDFAVGKSSTKINITTKFVAKKGISWGIPSGYAYKVRIYLSVSSI